MGRNMFGVARDFRASHGEDAFITLAKSVFLDADLARNGVIDASEIRAMLKKLGMLLTSDQADSVLRRYDADTNGTLDQTEWIGIVSDLVDGSFDSTGFTADNADDASENASLRTENTKLRSRVERLEELVNSLAKRTEALERASGVQPTKKAASSAALDKVGKAQSASTASLPSGGDAAAKTAAKTAAKPPSTTESTTPTKAAGGGAGTPKANSAPKSSAPKGDPRQGKGATLFRVGADESYKERTSEDERLKIGRDTQGVSLLQAPKGLAPVDEHDAKVRESFLKFDSNGDGGITLAELQAVLRSAWPKVPAATISRAAERSMSRGDYDTDGSISYTEFTALYPHMREMLAWVDQYGTLYGYI